MKIIAGAGFVALLFCLYACSLKENGKPLARLGDREVWLGDGKVQTLLSANRTLWVLPVRVINPGGEQISLEVQLECDRHKPQSGLVSLVNLRHQDPLMGLDRRDSSLERSWSGADDSLPPSWLRLVALNHCGAAKIPPRWRKI
jgi:hypothetical protein